MGWYNTLYSQKVNGSTYYKIKRDGSKVEQKEDYFSGSLSSDKIAVDVGDTLNEKIEIINLGKTVDYEFDGTSEDSATEIEKNKLFCEQHGGTFLDDNNAGWNDDSECHNIPVKICKIEASITDISIPRAVGQDNQPRIEINNNIPYLKWSPLKSNIDYDKGEPYEIDLDIDIVPGVFCGTKYEDKLRGDTIDLNNIQIQAGDTLLDKSVTLSDAEKTIKFDNGDISISNVITADFSPTIDFYGKISGTSLKKAHASVKSKLKLGDKFVIKANGNGKYIFNPKPIYTKKFTKIIPAGAVPIVVIGRLRLMVVAEIDAEGAIETTVDIKSALNMDIEVNYNPTTKSWDILKNKSFTYNINAGGKGNTKVTGTIRIIPSLELSLYETVASHFVLEPYIYSTVGIEGEINLNISKDIDTTLDKDIQFSALEAGVGLDAKVYVGPAWDSSDDIGLAWPKNAEYAASKLPLKDASFMNSKHISKVKDYYDATNTYNVYNLIDKTKILGIPNLTYTINTSELPPKDINSRAIKIVAECTPIDNILYPLGKKNYIECDSWKHESITNNFTILEDNKDEEKQNYWLIPNVNHNSNDTNRLRLVNNSSLNWARQYVTVKYHSFVDKDKIPKYWKVRYGVTDEGSDNDGDKYSNLLEYINGTSPDNSQDYPSNVTPDISNPLLDAPVNLNGTSLNNEIHLTWDSVNNATEYEVCLAKEAIADPSNCLSYVGGKLVDVSNSSIIIENLEKDTTYYLKVKGVASGYDGVWSDEINLLVKESNIPEDAKEINLCANQTAYLENKYTLGMQLNTQSITGNVFEKAEDFTGAAFCGEFASATSSQDVLDTLQNAFSDAQNVVTKNKSDGSIKVQYEMIGENIQAYSLLKSILEQAGVSDFSNYVDYATHSKISDVYIDLFIKYVNSSTVYVILAVTDKNVDNTDDLNTLVEDTSIAETQTVKQTNTDTFTYSANSLKTDILFVMDDSGSMSNEQSSASQAIINTFGTAMSSKGIDWKATVIGTGVNSFYSSKYINTPILNDINTLASQLKIGTSGSGNEEGLEHAYLRLKNGDISIRNDSKLSIVYISDEIEHTSLGELGVSKIEDSYFVTNKIKVNVIIPLSLTYSDGGNYYTNETRNNDLAYQMANATGGEVANLRNDTTGYDAMMQKIADDSAGSASAIILSKEPTVATILVKINGTKIDSSKWNYNSSNQSIVFIASATPNAGDKIEVVYNY